MEVLFAKRQKLVHELQLVDIQIHQQCIDRKRKVTKRNWNTVRSRAVADELLRNLSPDEIPCGFFTLQDKIDDITSQYEDSQCAIFYSLVSGVWFTVPYVGHDWERVYEQYENDKNRWVCVFAK